MHTFNSEKTRGYCVNLTLCLREGEEGECTQNVHLKMTKILIL